MNLHHPTVFLLPSPVAPLSFPNNLKKLYTDNTCATKSHTYIHSFKKEGTRSRSYMLPHLPLCLGQGLSVHCCYLVTKSCPTLCDPMDCSTPGLPVPHHLLKFAQVHVHCMSDTIQPSHPLMPSSPSALKSFPASRTFPMNQLFASDDQKTGVSASASVLPISIQGWFP